MLHVTDVRFHLEILKTCLRWLIKMSRTEDLFIYFFALQEGTSKFASLESCAKEHQKRTHKRLQLQKEMVSEDIFFKTFQASGLYFKECLNKLYNLTEQTHIKWVLASPEWWSHMLSFFPKFRSGFFHTREHYSVNWSPSSSFLKLLFPLRVVSKI